MNTEVWALYKSKGVNPFSGCLPMLVQLPIFWALFTTLRNAFELRGAPWIFWIKDLSAPDTLMTVSGVPINILPLIMGIGMFFQQKMMSVTTDQSQAMMMYMMPAFTILIGRTLPAALSLYWVVGIMADWAQQTYSMNHYHAKKNGGSKTAGNLSTGKVSVSVRSRKDK